MDQTLIATTGRIPGSRSSTRMRTDGHVPAVVYGLGRDTVSVSVPWTDLRRALNTEAGLNALITIDVDGTKDLAIVKDLQRHPVRRNVLHVDFLRVDPNAPVAVDVPVILIGEAKKVEGRRGIVDQPLKSLTIKAKPADIPDRIEVEISDLEIGVVVTVADLALPAGVMTEIDPGAPVVAGMATRFSVDLDHGGDGSTVSEDGTESAPVEASAE
jgi:large subunit ribosomal protein L25